MKDLEKFWLITSRYHNWKPSDIAFIDSICLLDGCVTLVTYSQIRNSSAEWPRINDDFFASTIKCLNVNHLNINFNKGRLQQISGFDIIDRSMDGLERINFEIIDYENDTLHFFCEEVNVIEIGILQKIVF